MLLGAGGCDFYTQNPKIDMGILADPKHGRPGFMHDTLKKGRFHHNFGIGNHLLRIWYLRRTRGVG